MIPKRHKQLFLSFLVMVSLVFMAIPFISPNSSVVSQASFNFCDSLGAGMTGAKSQIESSEVVAPKAGNRKWTVQELFSGSLSFTNYNGEGDETWYFAKNQGTGKGVPGYDDADVQNKIKSVRTIQRCMGGGFTSNISNALIWLSSQIVNVARFFTTTMLSGSIICEPGQTGGCINILGVIGGTGSDKGGIIGSLRDSIFSPLATLAFIFVGLWVAYKGLIKREFRASLFGILWSVGIFAAGVIALNNPMLLASAPQKANSVISTCIVGAMNGQSCLSGSVTVPSTLVGIECKSEANTTGNEGASMAANAMTCSIWKSFVLDAWSRAQFGTGYSNLYLANPPKDGSIWKHAPKDTSIYRVNLKSSGSASSMNNGRVDTSSEPVNNLALYQLYISTNMKSSTDTKYNSKTKDPRWYNIIVPATKDINMWNHWSPATGYGMKRMATSGSSFVVATAVSVSLILFSFWGLVYMFAGTLLMAFAPFFLLVAIEPGKGRKIFLGWLESVVSSILKYMASSLFIIIALTLYSSILSSTESYVTAFIGVMIMVGVLMMYRKEIVNMLGATSLGGQKLSNAVGHKLEEKGKSAKEFATFVGGSAIGGAMAASKQNDGFNPGQTLKGAFSGANRGARTHLRRGTGMLAGALRQEEASMRDYERRKAREEPESTQSNDVPTDQPSTDETNTKPPVDNDTSSNSNSSNSNSSSTSSGPEVNSESPVTGSPATNEPVNTMDEIKEELSKAVESTTSTVDSDEKESKVNPAVNSDDWRELNEKADQQDSTNVSDSALPILPVAEDKQPQPTMPPIDEPAPPKQNVSTGGDSPSEEKPIIRQTRPQPEAVDSVNDEGPVTESPVREETTSNKVILPDEELGSVTTESEFVNEDKPTQREQRPVNTGGYSSGFNSVLPELPDSNLSKQADEYVDGINKSNPQLNRPQRKSSVEKSFKDDSEITNELPNIGDFEE